MEELSKKELYDLERQNKKDKINNQETTGQKKGLRVFFISALIIILLGLFGWYLVITFSVEEEDVVARGGIHIHPRMNIIIRGERLEIPAGIGLSGSGSQGPVSPYHTHTINDSLHIEPQGLVTKEDIELERFFEAWGKDFNSECIFNNCNGPDGQLKMFVNGEENFDFENYLLQDGDNIEIIYE